MTFGTVISNLTSNIINPLVILAVGVGLVAFLYGLIRYITAGGDSKTIKEASFTMGFGIVVLFVMVAVWGLVEVLRVTLGVSLGDTPSLPQF